MIEEVDQELRELAVENVNKQQDDAFETLFAEEVEKHLKGEECHVCEDGLCEVCEERIASGVEDWQETQFEDQVEAEYDRLLEQR